MIFIVSALRCEADPFIKSFSLKKINAEASFNIYGSENMRLIISGIGGPAALCAVTYLLAISGASKEDILINCGCSGLMSGDPESRGKMYVVRSIKDEAFGRSFYPDMIKKLPFPEADLVTVPKVHTGTPGESITPILVDMEGAYVFQAASKFIYAHNIFILKTVSDSGHDSSEVRSDEIEDLIMKHIDPIRENLIVSAVHKTNRKTDLEGIDLKLSDYQMHELRKLAENYAVRHNDLNVIIGEFSKKKAANRREGRAVYAGLREKLLKP